jgi:hypothetical protein
MNVVGALREDEALRGLRERLQAPSHLQSVNLYLLRYLRAAHLDIDAAARKLESRRVYESMMSSIFSTPHAVSSLQSGAFSTLGEDVFRRPILYIRIRDYHHSGDSTSETRLAMMILEFMVTLVEARNVEQCLVLINEADAGFWAGRDAPMQERLAALVQKHYPGLVGAILVVNSSWGTKRILRLHAAAGGAPTEIRQIVQFVSSKDLQSVMAQDIIPREFGGGNDVNATCPPEEFADRVLRHWYAFTGLLQGEAESAGRPPRQAFQPLPRGPLFDATSSAPGVVQRRLATAASIGPYTAPTAAVGAASGSNGRPQSGSGSSRMHTARGTPGARTMYSARGDEATDDGICSAISDSDLFSRDEWSGEQGQHEKGAPSPSLPRQEISFNADDNDGVDLHTLRDRLQVEVQRRKQLEVTVDQLRLGTAYRGEDREKPIEAALRKHHEHVNSLVSQITAQHRGARPPRTLRQLLNASDQALLSAVADLQQTTPCMSGAEPVDRKPKSSCIVC